MIVTAELVRRIEASSARVSLATVAGFIGHASRDPARAVTFGSGALVAFGPGRYVNRAVGVAVDDVDDAGLDELESFFAARGLPPSLEVVSWAPAGLLARLAHRGYGVEWFRNVFARQVAGGAAQPLSGPAARTVTPDLVPEWLTVLRAGFGAASPEEEIRSDEMARAAHTVLGATAYLADIDGTPAGCGSLTVDDGVGWLGGAATIPSRRRHGVQGALVRHRLAAAEAAGCDLAVATAMPAGESARNLLRLGFTLVYGHAVMTRATHAGEA